MTNAATQFHFNRFLQLSAAVTRQVEEFNREEDARIEAAIKNGSMFESTWRAQHTSAVQARIDEEHWVAEGYEGHSGVPMVKLGQIYRLVQELKPIMENAQPLSAAQELALEYACMAANIA